MNQKYTFSVPALVTFSVTDPSRYHAFEDAFEVFRALCEGIPVKEAVDKDGDRLPVIRVFCIEPPVKDEEIAPGGNQLMPYYLVDIKEVGE